MQTDKQANEYKQIKSIHAHTHTHVAYTHACTHRVKWQN